MSTLDLAILLGFSHLRQLTPRSAADIFYFSQPIEADMISDFAVGRRECAASHLVVLGHFDFDGGVCSGALAISRQYRSYPFTFTLPASDLDAIVITIPGDTAGTWVMSGNAVGVIFVSILVQARPFALPPMRGRQGTMLVLMAVSQVVATNGAISIHRRQAGNRLRSNAVQPPVAGQEHGRLSEVLSGALIRRLVT